MNNYVEFILNRDNFKTESSALRTAALVLKRNYERPEGAVDYDPRGHGFLQNGKPRIYLTEMTGDEVRRAQEFPHVFSRIESLTKAKYRKALEPQTT